MPVHQPMPSWVVLLLLLLLATPRVVAVLRVVLSVLAPTLFWQG